MYLQAQLSTEKFPYCTPAEMEMLSDATANIFTDMLVKQGKEGVVLNYFSQTNERHQHALSVYSTTAQRCAALETWIKQVRTGLGTGDPLQTDLFMISFNTTYPSKVFEILPWLNNLS